MISPQGTSARHPVMICNWAKGGMRTVVEGYIESGLVASQNIKLLYAYTDGSPWHKFITFLIAFAQFWSLLIRGRVQFAHVHVAMKGSFLRKHLFICSAWLFKVPTITHLHGSEMRTFYEQLPAVGQFLVRWALTRTTRVFVLSKSWRDFVHHIAPKSRIEIIYNFVKIPKDNPASSSKKDFALFLGILGHRKGAFDLIEAWKDVVAELPEARLKLCGNGEVEQARALIEANQLGGSIELPGWVAPEARESLLEGCGVFVLPSYNEGLPMSLLEAMSFGNAVVTTRVGGIPELVEDERNGLLVSPGKPRELAVALLKILRNPERRLKLGGNAKATIESRFAESVIMPRIIQTYKDILSAAK